MTGDEFMVTAASAADVDGVIALIGRVFAEYGFIFDAAVEVPDLHAFAAHYAPPRLVLWSDTRFDLAHRLYERMGFRRTGERTLPEDVNDTREHGFERMV